MSRPSLRPTTRLRAALVAGAVLGASTLAGAPTTQATPNVVDNEATIWRIGGSAVTGSNPIPSGRTLTPVVLTTSDPETSANDGTILTGFVPGFRIGRSRVPARPAEQVTFRIDGAVVSTTVPDMRATSLQTDAGPLTAAVFTVGGVTYAIPRGAVGSATRTVAQSTVNQGTISVLQTHQWGLLPVGAEARVGTVLTQTFQSGAPSGLPGTTSRTVLDADDIRRNAGAIGEELVFVNQPGPTYNTLAGFQGTEVLVTVSLSSGATVVARGLQYDVDDAYGFRLSTWMLERSVLAAAGATVADITGVVSSVPSAHTLTWQELGFDVV